MAARGLHIAGVEHVINYDFPLNVQVRGARHEQVPHTARVARRGAAIEEQAVRRAVEASRL